MDSQQLAFLSRNRLAGCATGRTASMMLLPGNSLYARPQEPLVVIIMYSPLRPDVKQTATTNGRQDGLCHPIDRNQTKR
jgi:hypothetical protein